MHLIASIQVGQPTRYLHEGAIDGRERTWTTAFFKTPVAGRVWAGRTNLAGDRQADTRHHGGIDKAVLAYSADHYGYWRQHLNLPDMAYGAFGENLTIGGLDESGVAIGDRWRAGAVLLEVSQPRQPCWKMSRRWRIADLAKQVVANGKSGWYLRVLEEGELEGGMELDLVSRPHHAWTISRAHRTLYHQPDDVAAMEELANLPELSRAWREELLDRIARRAV
jgi:MOSC domain-containing protein YiiM